jgi:hypothetical protein
MGLDELNKLQLQQSSPDHENFFEGYPDTIRLHLNKIKQWKRKQIRKQGKDHAAKKAAEAEAAAVPINPAVIATPTGKLLPLHLLVRRCMVHAASKDEWDDKNLPDLKQPPTATVVALLMVLIGAYPDALTTQDAHGRTPLMTAMLVKDVLPSEEVVEVLLGMRTPGYQGFPTYLEDIDSLHTSTLGDSRWTNPAMIPSTDTHQLPLHVAAEESLSNYSLLSSVYAAYPGARLVQDIRGRTPLHLALGNYQKVSLDEKTLELLFTEKVAQTKDHDGKIPLDLVFAHKHSLQRPTAATAASASGSIYQAFFHASIEKPNNWRESRHLLTLLRQLPPWLRCHACAAGFVKDLLIEELARPFITAVILLNGCVLAALIIIFRLAMDEYASAVESVGGTTTEWYATAFYALAGYHLAGQVIVWIWSACLNEFYHLCLSNLWRWIDLVAACLPIATIFYISDLEEEHVVQLGTAATGFLWLSVIGYFGQWWHGMAVFTGSASKLVGLLFWPIVATAVLVVAFAQMFFTLPQMECIDGNSTAICSVDESFSLVYHLLLAEPVVEIGGNSSLSTGMLFLVVLFTILLIVMFLSVIVTAVVEGTHLDRDQIALKSYWEPKLAFVLSTAPLACSDGKIVERKQKIIEHPSCFQRYCSSLETVWHVLASSIQGGNGSKETHWDACCTRYAAIIPLRVVSVVILPIWFILGLVTFGLLWPPQVRRWLFQANEGNRTSTSKNDPHEPHFAKSRSEVLRLKSMSYEQSNDVQRELRELKLLILRAMESEEEYR